MSLPKTDHPISSIPVPSLGSKKKFRPFLTKEEKLLLMGKQSDNPKDMLRTMLQIVNNCCMDKLDVSTLPTFDVQYLYLQLRKASVGGKMEQKYRDEDGKLYTVTVNIEDIKCDVSKVVKNIEIKKDLILRMKFPSIEAQIAAEEIEDKKAKDDAYLIASLEAVFQGDEIFETKNEKPEDILEFVDNLPAGSYMKISEFFENYPAIHYETSYKNAAGDVRTITYETIEDFFI